MSESVSVEFSTVRVRDVARHGALIAIADVSIDIAGVEAIVHGVEVKRRPDGRIEARAPRCRDERGAWMAAVTLPAELEEAIGAQVLAEALRIAP